MVPGSDDVRSALERAVASREFRESPQLAAFLRFVVEETLAGRQANLKGYTIATSALGRPADFDPALDPIVRVQAARLRRALGEHNAALPPGSAMIVLEKGGYVPLFLRVPGVLPVVAAPQPAGVEAGERPPPQNRFRPAISAAAKLAALLALVLLIAWFLRFPANEGQNAGAGPPVTPAILISAVLPAAAAPLNSAAERLANGLTDALTRFDDVITRRDAAGSGGAASRHGELDYRLTVRVESVPGGKPVYFFRLSHEASGQGVWSQTAEPPGGDPVGQDSEAAIIRAVATALGQPYGVLFADIRARLAARPGSAAAFACRIKAMDYWLAESEAAHLEARACLSGGVARDPNDSTASALLSFLLLDEYRLGFNPLPGDPRARALEAAQRAVKARPGSARAHQAVMGSLFISGRTAEALAAGKRAYELNPFDTDITGDLGARYVQTGDAAQGEALLSEALNANPSPPDWQMFHLFLAAYAQTKTWDAIRYGKSVGPSPVPLFRAARAVAAALESDEAARAREVAAIAALAPGFMADPRESIGKRQYSSGMTAVIEDALRRARIMQ